MIGFSSLVGMPWTSAFSFGIAQMGKLVVEFSWGRFIVGSVVQSPEPTTIAKWGGFAKDIKGRDTPKY
jgi:hypothetical protein